MDILTLELPKDLLALLQKRAVEKGEEPQRVVLEILQKELAPEAKRKRERVRQKLREAGRIRPLGDELRKMIIPDVKHEDVEGAFARAGGKPLSQIVIEQRGPKL